MDPQFLPGLLGVAALVLANGFFVATEFGIVAVRRTRLDELAARGDTGARAAQQVVGHLDAYIAACQLGITMASLGLGWIGEPALAGLVEPPIRAVIGPYAPTAAHAMTAALAFVLITGLHIVIGELAPKGLALQRPDRTAVLVARPIRLFYFVFRWPVSGLNAVGNWVLRLAGLDPATGREQVHSVEELRYLLAASQHAGSLEALEMRVATRALEFAEHTAGSLMTPRTEVEALPLTAARDELLARVAETRHSRLPVYRESLDDIVGILHVRDLFPVLLDPERDLRLDELLRPVLAVPETLPADQLLERMRRERQQIAVVIDEYGGTAGIVTLEDVLEALVGRLDEGDAVAGSTSGARQDDGSVLLDGLTRVDELQELTGLGADDLDEGRVETVGGLLMLRLGRLPQVGDEVPLDFYRLRVEELDGRRVSLVRLTPGGREPPADPGS